MKIAIWGLGVSGKSILKYLLGKQEHEVFLINQGDVESWGLANDVLEQVITCREQDSKFLIDKIDQIILSPGVSRENPHVAMFIKAGIEVIGEVEYTFRQISTPIIAVTGTNGKTTTVMLIAEALRMAGHKVFLGGNIGVPFCESLKAGKEFDYIVLELSSFQLESIDKFKPEVAVVLNVSESHMERYENIHDYKKAKYQIFKNMGSKGLKLNETQIGKLEGLNIVNAYLQGDHSLKNLWVVQKVLDYFNVDDSLEVVKQLIETFTGAPYRCQKIVGNSNVFINDAKSTNWESTLSALRSTKAENIILIIGGKLRDKSVVKKTELLSFKLEKVFFTGESGKELYNLYKDDLCCEYNSSLEEILLVLKTTKKRTIIFSPAFPSFDQYKNYLERGEKFNRLLSELNYL